MEENQIQPQPYWADFKIKVGLYVNQNEGGESERVIDIVGCLGVTELTEEDLKIATDKNWVVITK